MLGFFTFGQGFLFVETLEKKLLNVSSRVKQRCSWLGVSPQQLILELFYFIVQNKKSRSAISYWNKAEYISTCQMHNIPLLY